MIQRNEAGRLDNSPVHHESSDAGDLAAFRNWLTRRNAARQQIRRLSPRELEVVSLVSSGLANKSIALRLQISVKTIEKHRANAARKMGVGSTAEMVRLAVEADQLPEPEVTADEAESAPREASSAGRAGGGLRGTHDGPRSREPLPTENLA